MKQKNINLIPSGTVALNANWTSGAILLESIVLYSLQLVCTGAVTGSFKLEASNDDVDLEDYANGGKSPTNWSTVASSSVAIVAAGDVLYTVSEVPYRWVRVVYTNSGGAGSLTSARANLKGF